MSKKVDTNAMVDLKNDLKQVLEKTEGSENGHLHFLYGLKYRFSQWVDEIIFDYLINRKRKFYYDLIYKLNIFDLDDFSDVRKAFPGNPLNSLYLAGGMDKAENAGRGPRDVIEYYFEVKHKASCSSNLPPITFMYNGVQYKVNPCRTIDDHTLLEYLNNPRKVSKMYERPVILNPVRKEVDRTKNKEFAKNIEEIHNGMHDHIMVKRDIEPVLKTFINSIEFDDEKLVNYADAVMVGINESAGAGTFAEMEVLSLMNKPMFCWFTNPEFKVRDLLLWNIPHYTKIARNEEEMEKMIVSIINYKP